MNRQKQFETGKTAVIRIFVFLGILLFGLGCSKSVWAGDATGGNVVTPDNFFDFFDEYGLLRDTVTCSELVFQGTFEGAKLNVECIILDRKITITGIDGEADENGNGGTETADMATLKEIGIVIAGEDVKIDHLNLAATSYIGSDLICVYADGAVISNSSIDYNAEEFEACAINVSRGGEISGVTISGNTITFESYMEKDSNYVAKAAINLENVDDAVVTNNVISASMTTVELDLYNQFEYDYFYGTIASAYTAPLRILNGSDGDFLSNEIHVSVNDSTGQSPSCQAVCMMGTEDAAFIGNTIVLEDEKTEEGKPISLYGISAACNYGAVIEENEIEISSAGGSFGADTAAGITLISDVISDEAEAVISGNSISCEFDGLTYGFYFPAGWGPAVKAVIQDNDITVMGKVAHNAGAVLVGIEAETVDAVISGNRIVAQNKNTEYDPDLPVTGIGCFGENGHYVNRVDIRGNDIYADSNYAVWFKYHVNEAHISGNHLHADDRIGDDAVYVIDASGMSEDDLTIAENTGLVIGVQPEDAFLGADLAADIELSVTPIEKAEDRYTSISYQWYSCNDKNGTNPVLIKDATKASYKIAKAEIEGSKKYYFCKATAKYKDSEETITEESDVVVVKDVRIFVSANGNDENGGSKDAPVASIKKAIELAAATGSKTVVVSGDFTFADGKNIVIDESVNIVSDPADPATLKEITFTIHADDVTVDGLKIKNTKAEALVIEDCEGVTVRGCEIETPDVGIIAHAAAVIENNTVISGGDYAIDVDDSKKEDGSAGADTIAVVKNNTLVAKDKTGDACIKCSDKDQVSGNKGKEEQTDPTDPTNPTNPTNPQNPGGSKVDPSKSGTQDDPGKKTEEKLIKTTLKAKNAKIKLKKKSKIKVTLTGADKKKIGGVKLTMKIGKKTYKAKTNKKGVATFKVKLTKKGKYKATIAFEGNEKYAKAAKKIKITVK